MSGDGPAAAARALAANLRDSLAEGLPLDAGALELILQSLDLADPAEALARLDADPDAAEHAHLAALVYSPGPGLMRVLEPFLAQAGLDRAGAEELAGGLARHLEASGRPVRALLPNGRRVALSPRPQDLLGLALRLRPWATAPAELRALLERRCAPPLAAELAVRLRHSRLDWTREQVFFVAALLERAPEEDLEELLAWALRFLDLTGAAELGRLGPRLALARRRQALAALVLLAGGQEQARGRGSFEVLQAQGLRMGHVHGPDVEADLALLDRACRLVLGLPGEALDGVLARDLGQASDVAGVFGLFDAGREGERQGSGGLPDP